MFMRSPTRWARPKLVRPPGFILPCQPVLATKVPVGEGWLHELKHDGFRILTHKDGERVHLWSRAAGRLTANPPETSSTSVIVSRRKAASEATKWRASLRNRKPD